MRLLENVFAFASDVTIVVTWKFCYQLPKLWNQIKVEQSHRWMLLIKWPINWNRHVLIVILATSSANLRSFHWGISTRSSFIPVILLNWKVLSHQRCRAHTYPFMSNYSGFILFSFNSHSNKLYNRITQILLGCDTHHCTVEVKIFMWIVD